MRRSKIFLSVLLSLCMVLFIGCSYTFPFSTSKINKYVPESDSYAVIEEGDFDDLDYQARKQLIAEKYIDISFTVLVYKVVEVEEEGVVTSSNETQYSFGSGFIVHTGGYILTNSHVINKLKEETDVKENGSTITTTFYKCYVSQDGAFTKYEAELLWSNEVFDMAIIICEEFDELEAAVLKDRTIFCDAADKIRVLERIITVGTQNNLEYYATATSGEITSRLLRVAISDGKLYEHLIQHDAPINHGNSGGALIDLDGNVIGLNTLGNDNANSLFFAVSIYPAMAILDAIVDNYENTGSATEEILFGFVGTDAPHVRYSSDPSINFSGSGVYVVSVEAGCIIEGLQAGDVIVGLNAEMDSGEIEFETSDQNKLLYARIHLLYAQSAIVKVVRGGTQIELPINI